MWKPKERHGQSGQTNFLGHQLLSHALPFRRVALAPEFLNRMDQRLTKARAVGCLSLQGKPFRDETSYLRKFFF